MLFRNAVTNRDLRLVSPHNEKSAASTLLIDDDRHDAVTLADSVDNARLVAGSTIVCIAAPCAL